VFAKGHESACKVHKNSCRCNESACINRESATRGLEIVAEAVRVFAGALKYQQRSCESTVVKAMKVPVEALRLLRKAVRVLV
jgi:hypothetical protein